MANLFGLGRGIMEAWPCSALPGPVRPCIHVALRVYRERCPGCGPEVASHPPGSVPLLQHTVPFPADLLDKSTYQRMNIYCGGSLLLTGVLGLALLSPGLQLDGGSGCGDVGGGCGDVGGVGGDGGNVGGSN